MKAHSAKLRMLLVEVCGLSCVARGKLALAGMADRPEV